MIQIRLAGAREEAAGEVRRLRGEFEARAREEADRVRYSFHY
jgi:hypothetical protein